MAGLELPEPYDSIDRLIEAGDFDGASAALDSAPSSEDPVFDMLRIKLEMVRGAMHPGLAMQRLLALMRRHADLPGAQELYRDASRRSYEGRQSSFAHSHPPPPPAREDEDTE